MKLKKVKVGGDVAKYDWIELKRDYLLGDYKSLRIFAEEKGIPFNGYFKKSTVGWSEEKRLKRDQKETKIIEQVTQKQIETEVNRNTVHLKTGDDIMKKLNLAVSSLDVDNKNALYLLQSAAATLEKIQKVQRLGENTEKANDNGVLTDILEYLKNGGENE